MAPKKKSSTASSVLELGSSFVNATKEILARKGIGANNRSGSDMFDSRQIIPIPNIGFQAVLGLRGLFSGTLLTVIAPDGVGKTSLFFTIAGWGARIGSPSMYVETENKMMDRDRILRCLHPNPIHAQKIFDTIYTTQSFEIVDATNHIENWCRTIRDKKNPVGVYVPISIPAIVGLDTFSKLMSPDEAIGYSKYGDIDEPEPEKEDGGKDSIKKQIKKKIKALGTGSNFGHSKIAQSWSRRLPYIMSEYNVLMVIMRHQNDKVDMSTMPGSAFISPEQADAGNRTSNGGRAFAQSSAYELIISRKGHDVSQVRGERRKVAQKLKLSVSKNSYGPPMTCEYLLNLMGRRDTEHSQEMVLDFDQGFCLRLFNSKLLHMTKKSDKCYSCRELGLDDAEPQAIVAALYKNPDLMESLCGRLNILGYKTKFQMPALNAELVAVDYVKLSDEEISEVLTDEEEAEKLAEEPQGVQ